MYMGGTTSSTRNLWNAIKYSKCSRQHKKVPGKSVIFIILFQNYDRFYGFRLNKLEYTPYPYEEEYLLIEGSKFRVLKVEDSYTLRNEMDHLRS